MCKLPELENVAIYHTNHVSVVILHTLITLDCILLQNHMHLEYELLVLLFLSRMHVNA